jgi:hypothetical protein
MGSGRSVTVIILGCLGAAVVYSLMMAFGDPALELEVCAAWLPLYMGAYALGFAGTAPARVAAAD